MCLRRFLLSPSLLQPPHGLLSILLATFLQQTRQESGRDERRNLQEVTGIATLPQVVAKSSKCVQPAKPSRSQHHCTFGKWGSWKNRKKKVWQSQVNGTCLSLHRLTHGRRKFLLGVSLLTSSCCCVLCGKDTYCVMSLFFFLVTQTSLILETTVLRFTYTPVEYSVIRQ